MEQLEEVAKIFKRTGDGASPVFFVKGASK